MPTYYTEYPTGWFNVSSDEEALLHEPDAKVIYKQSDTPDGRPFIIIRDTYAGEKTFTFTELEKIIRDRMYTTPNGRQPNEGCNAKMYALLYFLEHGEDDPNA